MSGLGIKAPKIRDQSIASPQESIEPPVERVFRDLRPKGEAKLYITIPLTPQRSMTVLALDDTSAVAGTLQCLVEELLQPLFVVAHEANYYFRQLLAGGLTYQYRIVLFRHLVEHYSNAGEKRRWHILSLLGEWMRIHSEDFEKGSQLHEYLCAFHYDAIQEALTRGLSKDEVGRIKGQQAELRQMNQVQAVYKQVAVAQHQMLFHPSSINQVFGSRIIADKPPCILGILNVRLVAQYLAAVVSELDRSVPLNLTANSSPEHRTLPSWDHSSEYHQQPAHDGSSCQHSHSERRGIGGFPKTRIDDHSLDNG